MRDLRYAERRLRNGPGFSTVSVFALALATGASTAIFAVDPILFETLPYPQADGIAMISDVKRLTGQRVGADYFRSRDSTNGQQPVRCSITRGL
jgi:hypothetical protein